MALLANYAIKMVSVFSIVTATIMLCAEFMAHWLGYVIALVLLLGSSGLPWIESLFLL
jgi:hypothetical protein